MKCAIFLRENWNFYAQCEKLGKFSDQYIKLSIYKNKNNFAKEINFIEKRNFCNNSDDDNGYVNEKISLL